MASHCPATADDPSRALPNRVPSSSLNAMTSSAKGRDWMPPLGVDVAQQPDDLERHQHPDDAVEAPGVGNRVEVRTEEQRGGVGGAGRGEPPDLIAGGILPCRHAQLAHPLGGEAVDRACSGER